MFLISNATTGSFSSDVRVAMVKRSMFIIQNAEIVLLQNHSREFSRLTETLKTSPQLVNRKSCRPTTPLYCAIFSSNFVSLMPQVICLAYSQYQTSSYSLAHKVSEVQGQLKRMSILQLELFILSCANFFRLVKVKVSNDLTGIDPGTRSGNKTQACRFFLLEQLWWRLSRLFGEE